MPCTNVFWAKKKIKYSNTFLFFGFFILALFMCTFYAKPVWDLLQPIWYVQFPWRFLLLAGFFSSVLSGALLQASIFKYNAKRLTLAVFIIIAIILMNKNYFVPEKYFKNVRDSDYINKEIIRYETSKLAAEYAPKGIATRKTDINTTVVDIDKNSIAKKSYNIVSGYMNVIIVKDLVHSKKFIINTENGGVFRVNTYSFPGWMVYMDGKNVNYSDNNRLKLVTIQIPQGEHIVNVEFTDTQVRKIANMISAFAIIGIVLFGLL